jgi:hypothetical protein
VQADTAEGDGSTSGVRVWVTDATGAVILAREDQADYGTGRDGAPPHLSVPVTLGATYYFFVEGTASTSSPTTDFYYIEHFVGADYAGTLESETIGGSNDAIPSAELWSSPIDAPGAYFVDGSIDPAGEQDFFRVDPPAGSRQVSLSCAAQRLGSGVRGLSVLLATSDGSAIAGTSATETAMLEAAVSGVALPVGTTQAFLRVRGGSQDPTVVGTHYACSVHFAP